MSAIVEAEFVWITSPSSPGLSMRIEMFELQVAQLGVPGAGTVAWSQFQFQFQIQTGASEEGGGPASGAPVSQFQFQFQIQVDGWIGGIV